LEQQEGFDPNSFYQTQQVANGQDQVQYEYVNEGEQDSATTIAPGEGDTEVVEKQPVEQNSETDDKQEETVEEEPDKEVAEDRRRMPQVIIGPPIGAQLGTRK